MELVGHKVIRAFRCQSDSFDSVLDYLEICRRLGFPPSAALVDAYEPGHYGGTGKTLNWSDVRRLGAFVGGVHLVLAGGLSPTNVASAISDARPTAVDVASGVEASPGHKDRALVRTFIHAAREAFAEAQSRP